MASSARPMLVGEVRCAIAGDGMFLDSCPAAASGLPAPTKVSKNAQVLRASLRRKTRLRRRRARAARRASGRLIHQAMQRARRATAAGSARPPPARRARDASRQQRRRNRERPARSTSSAAKPARSAPPPAIDVARRRPFQQLPARDEHAPQRAHDRVEAEARLVRQAGERERRLRERAARPSARSPARCCAQQRRRRGLRSKLERREALAAGRSMIAEHRQRPEPGRRSTVQPSSSSSVSAAGDQAAAQVVEDLPARQRRQRIAARRRPPAPGTRGSSHADDLPVAADPAVPAR